MGLLRAQRQRAVVGGMKGLRSQDWGKTATKLYLFFHGDAICTFVAAFREGGDAPTPEAMG
jgi:hypothetical protein